MESKVENEFEWFFFTFDLLNDLELFPFHLYIFNPGRKKGSLIVSANSPLTEEKKAMILKFVKLGGVPAIKSTQKLTFMTFLELPENEQGRLDNMNKFIRKRCESIEEDIEDGDNPLDELDQEMDANDEMFEEEPPTYDETPKDRFDSSLSSPFDLKNKLTADAYSRNLKRLFKEDFPPLIKELKQDIEEIDHNRSGKEIIKMAKVLAARFLLEDNLDSRTAAVTHLFLKKFGITDPEYICSLFVSVMLRNIGLTRVRRGVLRRREFDDALYEKHPLMSKDLLDMASVTIPPQIPVLLEESHAIGGGYGFPMVRNPESMDPAESAFFFASFLIESCYTYPKTKIGNIKSTFQEYQASQEKAKKIFGHKINEIFSKIEDDKTSLGEMTEEAPLSA